VHDINAPVTRTARKKAHAYGYVVGVGLEALLYQKANAEIVELRTQARRSSRALLGLWGAETRTQIRRSRFLALLGRKRWKTQSQYYKD
jgi:hypothetical protein